MPDGSVVDKSFLIIVSWLIDVMLNNNNLLLFWRCVTRDLTGA